MSANTLVVDLGSHLTRVGSSSASHQESLTSIYSPDDDVVKISETSSSFEAVPTLIGYPKMVKLNGVHLNHQKVLDELKFGNECILRSPLLSVHPLIQQGEVSDWDDLELFLTSVCREPDRMLLTESFT